MSQKIETRIGNLAELVPQFEPETCLTSAELANELRSNYELMSQTYHFALTYYTANYALYAVEDGKAFLYLCGKRNNPLFNSIDEASRQLINGSNYVPMKNEAESAKQGGLKIGLDHLCLQANNDEISCFDIPSKGYELLNPTQWLFAESIYGQGKDFIKSMDYLKEFRIDHSTICVLNPAYVKENAQKDGAIIRACLLNFCCDYSLFNAGVRSVNSPYAMRGIPKAGSEEEKTCDCKDWIVEI